MDHSCRDCGARFRATALGWVATLVVLAVLILWFVMFQMHLISPLVAIALTVATCGLATWLLPYFTPVRLEQKSTKGP